MRRKTTNNNEHQHLQRKAIGYVRVSTEDQADNGRGLQKQEQRIRAEADARGLSLIDFYRDVASGVGSRSFFVRDELQAALRVAKLERIPIIVSKHDRLSREPEVLNGILQLEGVEIISCDPRDMSSKEMTRQRAEKAKQTADNISEGKKRSQAKKKARGEKVGYPETLDAGRIVSARVRQEKAAESVERIAILLDRNPGLAEKTASEIANALNAAGFKTPRNRFWTIKNIRPKLREALKLIKERDDISDELGELPTHEEVFGTSPAEKRESDPFLIVDGDRMFQPVLPPRGFALGSKTQVAHVDTQPAPDADVDAEEAELQRRRMLDPNWGRF